MVHLKIIMQHYFEQIAVTFPVVVALCLAGWLALILLARAFRRLERILVSGVSSEKSSEREKRIHTLLGIAQAATRTVFIVILSLVILKKIGLDIGPILAGAGVAGVAIGLGAQELIRDIIAGFFMLLGDYIRIGDVVAVNGTSGFVEQLGLRTVMIRDVEGAVYVFQNGKVQTLANMTKDWSAAVFETTIDSHESVGHVIETIRKVSEEISENPLWSDDKLCQIEIFGVEYFDDSSVKIKSRIKMAPGRQWDVAREFRRLLKEAFDREGISIPHKKYDIRVVK